MTSSSQNTWEVTDSLTVAVDADPKLVLGALWRLDLPGRATLPLAALGLEDHLVAPPALVAPPTGCDLALELGWAIRPQDRQADVVVRWEFAVRPSADGDGSLLSVRSRFTPRDAGARAALLDAWRLVGEGSRTLARHTLAAAVAYADAVEDDVEVSLHGAIVAPIPLTPAPARARVTADRRSA